MRTIAAVVKIVANSRPNPNLRITSITSLATPPAPAGVKAMLYGLIKPESVWARARGERGAGSTKGDRTTHQFDPFGAKPAPDAQSKGLFGAKRGNR